MFSLYNSSQSNPVFQIDANLGYPAAVLVSITELPINSSNHHPNNAPFIECAPPSSRRTYLVHTPNHHPAARASKTMVLRCDQRCTSPGRDHARFTVEWWEAQERNAERRCECEEQTCAGCIWGQGSQLFHDYWWIEQGNWFLTKNRKLEYIFHAGSVELLGGF